MMRPSARRSTTAILVSILIIPPNLQAAVLKPILIHEEAVLVTNGHAALTCERDGTNPGEGNQKLTGQGSPGRSGSPAIVAVPVYNSGNLKPTVWGVGWSSDVDQYITLGAKNSLTWADGNGAMLT